LAVNEAAQTGQGTPAHLQVSPTEMVLACHLAMGLGTLFVTELESLAQPFEMLHQHASSTHHAAPRLRCLLLLGCRPSSFLWCCLRTTRMMLLMLFLLCHDSGGKCQRERECAASDCTDCAVHACLLHD
jgi:hypothetical protein